MTNTPKLKPKYSPQIHFSIMIDEAIKSLFEADVMAAKDDINLSTSSRNVYKQIIDGAIIMAAHVEPVTWSEFNFSERFPSSRKDLYETTKRLRRHTMAIEDYFEDRGFNISLLDHLKFRLD